ncbi:hypothetical protein TNIN_80121 [Trichonephila inaurata madagascariensis]|uniref:Uncharacterized protein n=1 Tax=Trichonephila inaurata madagascariensis TaxID=2747483 RepID=A0A8X6JQ55_9ARAC|nr:hypothetical protein TNIN_80121 [Trichonephila inaurata madagascariensis]
MFNGTKSLLYFMSALGLSLGTAAHAERHCKRVTISDVREHGSMREGKIARRQNQLDLLEDTFLISDNPNHRNGDHRQVPFLEGRSGHHLQEQELAIVFLNVGSISSTITGN